MKKIWAFLIDPDRPRLLTILGFFILLSTVVRILILLIRAMSPEYYIGQASILGSILGSIINLTLLYYLLAGRNWARVVELIFPIMYLFALPYGIAAQRTSPWSLLYLPVPITYIYILLINESVKKYFKQTVEPEVGADLT